MRTFLKNVRRFLNDQTGPTAVEYAVMLALIVVVSLAAIRTIGTQSRATFRKVGTSLRTANS